MRPAILLAALLFTLRAPAQWTIQPASTTADLRGIHVVTPEIAWASGTAGTVLRTTDAGAHWAVCPTPPGAEKLDFRGIQAFDADTAIVMSSGKGNLSRLYKTTDACHTWTLLFTNPDSEGFWDAIEFSEATEASGENHWSGFLLGDPVNGEFVIYGTPDSGQSWRPWSAPKNATRGYAKTRPAKSRTEECIFAASNSAMVRLTFGIAFVTGGKGGSRIFVEKEHAPFDAFYSLSFSTQKLPFDSSESSGAFSVASDGKTYVIVGGDFLRPDESKDTAALLPFLGQDAIPSMTPPHGYRSAVAYSPAAKTWITVGPNGTDISTDDGRNWRALRPSASEAPDADQHWNALSLPYVVGPHGRIGRLRPEALRVSQTTGH